jgi:transposase
MARHRAPYPPELRQQLVDLVWAGRSPVSCRRNSKPPRNRSAIGSRKPSGDRGKRRDGLTSAEREELTRLRHELRQAKLERDILGKAAAWFAQETEAKRKRFFGS